MSTKKPRVFLGSSKESLPVLKVISESIKTVATVVAWTDMGNLKKPGTFFLDSLINVANSFDFAILIFGKDDVVISRKRKMPGPRDNVIFELGLFMSVLDRLRTLIVSPRIRLKILTDLQGLNLTEYDPPKRHSELKDALKPIISHIRQQIRDQDVKLKRYAPTGVATVWPDIERFLLNRRINRPSFENIALDMEMTWRWLQESVLKNPDRRNASFRILFADHNSISLRNFHSDSFSMETARQREKEIKEYFAGDLSVIRNRGIKIAIRKYDSVPVLHGFMVNRRHLFLSACKIGTTNELVASPNPYLIFESPKKGERDIVAAHLFGVFSSWFDFLWSRAAHDMCSC